MSRESDKWVKRWVIPSHTSMREYIVAQDKDGNWACSCPGWTRHVPRTDCKHIRTVKSGGGMSIEDNVIVKLGGEFTRTKTYKKTIDWEGEMVLEDCNGVYKIKEKTSGKEI